MEKEDGFMKYEEPDMQIITFLIEDIVCESNKLVNENDTDIGDW